MERLNECSGRSEPFEKDECVGDDNPVERYAAERQEGRYDDERNAGDGDGPTAANHISIVAGLQSARSLRSRSFI